MTAAAGAAIVLRVFAGGGVGAMPSKKLIMLGLALGAVFLGVYVAMAG